MNEIVRTEVKPSIVAGGSVASIVPRNLDEAFRLSTAIHQAGMAPYGIDTPQKIMIAMLAGLELGMPPMQGVQSIAVINNRPCMWGDALIGVVKNSGVCLYVKEWMEGDGDSRIAFCETKRKGEDEPVKRSFSADDAKRAGLWQTEARVTKQGKNGPYTKDNDSPWFKYPQRMLQMRARAWCLRDVYPDVLKGMQSREEVEDYQHASAEPIETQATLPPLQERLRIAKQEHEPAEGFDAAHVKRETATLAGDPAGGQGEDISQSSTTDDGSADASMSGVSDPAAGNSEPAAADQEEDAQASETSKADHGGQSASSSELSDEQRGKLFMLEECADVMFAAATHANASERVDRLDKARMAWLSELSDDKGFVQKAFETCSRLLDNPSGRDQVMPYLKGQAKKWVGVA